jgi:hypothetical protein
MGQEHLTAIPPPEQPHGKTMKHSLYLAATVLSAVALVAAAASTPVAITPGTLKGDYPFPVGKAKYQRGASTSGEPAQATIAEGKTTDNGQISHRLRNDTHKHATDLHVRVFADGKNYGIRAIEFTSDGTFTPFSDTEADDKHSAAAKAPIGGGNTDMGHGAEGTLNITIVDLSKTPHERVDEADVKLKLWWTRGNDRDIAVVAFSNGTAGSADPPVTVASVVPSLASSVPTVTWAGTQMTVVAPDLPIAERDGHQFSSGEVLISALSGVTYDISSVTIDLYDTLGAQVVAPDADTDDLRVDSAGNIVFDLERSTTYTGSLIVVVRGLKIELPGGTVFEDGQEFHAGLSGPAIQGGELEDLWHLFTISVP